MDKVTADVLMQYGDLIKLQANQIEELQVKCANLECIIINLVIAVAEEPLSEFYNKLQTESSKALSLLLQGDQANKDMIELLRQIAGVREIKQPPHLRLV